MTPIFNEVMMVRRIKAKHTVKRISSTGTEVIELEQIKESREDIPIHNPTSTPLPNKICRVNTGIMNPNFIMPGYVYHIHEPESSYTIQPFRVEHGDIWCLRWNNNDIGYHIRLIDIEDLSFDQVYLHNDAKERKPYVEYAGAINYKIFHGFEGYQL